MSEHMYGMAQREFYLLGAEFFVTLVGFSVMASREGPAEEGLNYSTYSSLGFLVFVGVIAWLFTMLRYGVRAYAVHGGRGPLLQAGQLASLELLGSAVCAFGLYTAFVGSSSVSSTLHKSFTFQVTVQPNGPGTSSCVCWRCRLPAAVALARSLTSLLPPPPPLGTSRSSLRTFARTTRPTRLSAPTSTGRPP